MRKLLAASAALILCLVLGSGIRAQESVQLPEPAQASQPAQPARLATPLPARALTLTVGRGELLQFSDDTSRVSVSDPTIADAIVVSTHDVVLNGKGPGNTTIMIWHGDNVSPYNITVEPDLTEIQKQLRATFPSD